jgi:hypothetical protein
MQAHACLRVFELPKVICTCMGFKKALKYYQKKGELALFRHIWGLEAW